MSHVKDFRWSEGIKVDDFVNSLGAVGFQSVELARAKETILKMRETGAKIFLTFTSNMVTSGLRGFFAQLIELGMADSVVTTVGAIEEDIMRSMGEDFVVGSFDSDDFALYEEGVNRVGNLFIKNKSYEKFEGMMRQMLKKLYEKKKNWPVSEMLKEIGLMMEDNASILYQAAKKDVPIFCPAITDGAFGFHLFMFQQDNPDFMVDVVKDFSNILFFTSQDDKKGAICLGGGVSKHHAIFSCLLNGGLDYAVYMTTSRHYSGSMSGATTKEAKSWGKIKDNSDAVTVIGDVTITFPLVMCSVLEELNKKGLVK
ncbi:deoxyhypusine synthase [Candidatus Aenigmatarchaeota archaeon]